MPERPVKLPFAALAVIKWSRVLSSTEKWILHETYAMDNGPEGAWISNASLADRLGLEERTVKNCRIQLRKDGLLFPVPREGARQVGWVFTLPAAAVPHDRRTGGAAASKLGQVLDGHLREQRGLPGDLKGLATGTMKVPDPGPASVPKEGPSRSRNRDHQGTECEQEGGQGGDPPTSSLLTESQLHPAVTDLKDGEVSHETQEVGTDPNGTRRQPGESTHAWMTRLGRKRA